MTGILPIKKYGSHSALNMFDEFSMANPGPLAHFVGFTDSEVRNLCQIHDMDFEEIRHWYDGYCFGDSTHIYNPRSVVSAMLSHSYDNFWSKTETFEALRDYIIMNFDGLKDSIVELLSGARKKINTNTFSNDMATFHSANDVLTLLIHLGYLGYDFATREVFIPNSEIFSEFHNAVESTNWNTVIDSLRKSEALLQATIAKDSDTVASLVSDIHMETSLLTYNDENNSESAISQIKEKHYVKSLENYSGNILLVGINYDPKSKEHQCKIEEYHKP